VVKQPLENPLPDDVHPNEKPTKNSKKTTTLWSRAIPIAHNVNRISFVPNVRRQVSLAGGEDGSQKRGVKTLGMLFFQHPLCLNAEPR